MKVCENVYQIKIEFKVTEKVKRYVFLYLITGEKCYLIDAGVTGSGEAVKRCIDKLGRSFCDINAVFLTHAHPDHIGGAAEIKKASGCEIYISQREKKWAEDIDLQFTERPIPNFYGLVGSSVLADKTVNNGDKFSLEDGITLRVIGSAGHSDGSVSYLWEEKGILFSGDAIPNLKDLPILTDIKESKETLKRLKGEKGVKFCCPAWDEIYTGDEMEKKLLCGEKYLEKFEISVKNAEKQHFNCTESEKLSAVCENMGFEREKMNPLFKRSVEAVK